MNAPTNDYGHHRLSNFNDSEQSLRRSFFAIHRPNSPTTAAVQNPASSSANNNNNNGSAAVGNGGRRRGAQMRPMLQKQSSSRRVSVETTLTSRDVSMLPSLPFSSKAELLTNHPNPRPPPPHRSRERGDDATQTEVLERWSGEALPSPSCKRPWVCLAVVERSKGIPSESGWASMFERITLLNVFEISNSLIFAAMGICDKVREIGL